MKNCQGCRKNVCNDKYKVGHYWFGLYGGIYCEKKYFKAKWENKLPTQKDLEKQIIKSAKNITKTKT